MGRANNKKRSWRRVDAKDVEQSAEMKSAADSSLFVIDGVTRSVGSKSIPSKNTLQAAKKLLKSNGKLHTESHSGNPSSLYDLWAGPNKFSSKTRPAVLAMTEPVLAGTTKKNLQPVHPGTSYNPLVEDREKAIQIAYEIHVKENKPELIWNEKMQKAKAAVVGTEDNGQEDEEVAEESIIVKPSICAEDRITKAIRNKRRRHKMLMAEAARRKQNKVLLKQIDVIDKLEIVKPTEKNSMKSRRIQLGKYKVKPEFPAVLLSEEITNNLRDVAFQPNILRDTFLNFQRKGLIEARHKVKPTAVRVKLYNRYKDHD